jgi:hypothetical protein
MFTGTNGWGDSLGQQKTVWGESKLKVRGPQIMLNMFGYVYDSMYFYFSWGVNQSWPIPTWVWTVVGMPLRTNWCIWCMQNVPIEYRGNCHGRLQPLHLQPQNFYEYQRNACVHSQSCLLRSSKPFNFPTPAMSFPWEFSGTSAARNQLGFGRLGHAPRQSNPATSCMFGWCDWWLSDTELDTNVLLILKQLSAFTQLL